MIDMGKIDMGKLLRPGGLFDQAETALRRALAVHPHDVPTLVRLGTVQRGKGDLAAALETYRRVIGLCPGHPEASWMSAVLGGAALPDVSAHGSTLPVPFVRMTDFLPRERCDDLLTLVTPARERFVPAMISRGLDPDTRHALVAGPRIRREVRPWFVPRLRGVLEAVWARLAGAPLGAYRVELDVTAHPDGHFFKLHRDWDEKNNPRRRISYAWYFHREPRRFAGGDLLLHDTDREAGRYDASAFTRIDPLHNSIVFFPSDCWHQITPVHGGGDDFGDGRFTVNGWLLRAEKPDGCASASASAEAQE